MTVQNRPTNRKQEKENFDCSFLFHVFITIGLFLCDTEKKNLE